MRHPRIAILISSLIEEEDIFKKKIIGSLSQMTYEVFLDHSSVSKDDLLPFSKIIDLILETKKNNRTLRSALDEANFIEKLLNLTLKCETFLFNKIETENNNTAKEEDESNEAEMQDLSESLLQFVGIQSSIDSKLDGSDYSDDEEAYLMDEPKEEKSSKKRDRLTFGDKSIENTFFKAKGMKMNEKPLEEQKELEIVMLLQKILQETPKTEKLALQQILNQTRSYGPDLLFQKTLPLFLSDKLQDSERLILLEIVHGLINRTGDSVRPYVHKILVVIEPLLIDKDYNLRTKGKNIISKLAKTVGLATMISNMASDIRHDDQYVRNITAKAFGVVASTLGVPKSLSFLQAVCESKKGWQVRHTGIKIIQEIAVLMGHHIVSHLNCLIEMIKQGLNNVEHYKVQIVTCQAVASLARASHPNGIEAFTPIIGQLWDILETKNTRLLAASLQANGYVIALMKKDHSKIWIEKIISKLLKHFDTLDGQLRYSVLIVLSQCLSSEIIDGLYLEDTILPLFLQHFFTPSVIMEQRSYKKIVEITERIANKGLSLEIIQRIIPYLMGKDQALIKITFETITKILISHSMENIDCGLECKLMNGIFDAFHKQLLNDSEGTFLRGFISTVNCLGHRIDSYIHRIEGLIKWMLHNKCSKIRKKAADLFEGVVPAMKKHTESFRLKKLAIMLYYSLGEDFSELVGFSINCNIDYLELCDM